MKTKTRLAKSCGLIGAGVSAALYAVFGLMQGMALGGTAGLLLAQEIYGPNTLDIVGSGLITRVILAASMLAGAFVALIMFLVLGSALGYASGYVLGLTIKEEVAGEPGQRESY
jgi:hypothetical protein